LPALYRNWHGTTMPQFGRSSDNPVILLLAFLQWFAFIFEFPNLLAGTALPIVASFREALIYSRGSPALN